MSAERKKPGATWSRPRNVALALSAVVLLMLGWAVFEVLQTVRAVPSPSIDYRAQFRRLTERRSGVRFDESHRSWSLLCDTLNLAKIIELEMREDPSAPGFERRDKDDNGRVDFTRLTQGESLPAHVDRERRALQTMRQRGLFERLAQLRDTPMAWRPSDLTTPMNVQLLPELAMSRDLAKMLAGAMRLWAAEGDIDQAIEAFMAGLTISRTLSHDPGLVNSLVAMAINALLLNEMRDLLWDRQLSEAQCQAVLDALAKYKPADIALVFEGERAVFHDTLQHSFTDDGSGDGIMIPRALEQTTLSPTGPEIFGAVMARFIYAGRAQTAQKYNEYIDKIVAEAALPRRARWKGKFSPDRFIETLPNKFAVVRMIAPALDSAIDVHDADRVRWEGTRIMAAIALYRSRYGRWPESLAALVPEILPVAPSIPCTACRSATKCWQMIRTAGHFCSGRWATMAWTTAAIGPIRRRPIRFHQAAVELIML